MKYVSLHTHTTYSTGDGYGSVAAHIRRVSEFGWCGPPVCATHDGVPTTEAEDDDFDLCHHVVRLYADKQQREAVEANHSPSLWRGANIPNPEESE